MSRPLRVEYAGAVYHVMSRGNDRQEIFVSSADRLLFLDTLRDACVQTGWRIHAYALMPNHYHLLLETPEPNLVAGMKWFQGTYTQRFNLRHQRAGHLYQGRYKSLPVDGSDASYFSRVGTYIHLNPVRAGLVRDEPDLARDSLITSYPYYAGAEGCPEWLGLKRLISCCGVGGKSEYREYIVRAISDLNAGWMAESVEQIRRAGWFHGDDIFKEFLSSLVDETMHSKKNSLHGLQRSDHGGEKAEQLLGLALKQLNLSESELLSRRAVDEEKQAVAWLLKMHTTVTVSWIAQRLSMGHRTNVSRAVKKMSSGIADNPFQDNNKMLNA